MATKQGQTRTVSAGASQGAGGQQSGGDLLGGQMPAINFQQALQPVQQLGRCFEQQAQATLQYHERLQKIWGGQIGGSGSGVTQARRGPGRKPGSKNKSTIQAQGGQAVSS